MIIGLVLRNLKFCLSKTKFHLLLALIKLDIKKLLLTEINALDILKSFL